MREVTTDYLAQVKSSGRQFGFYVAVYNGEEPDTFWLGDIISIDITRCFSDKLQIGACMSDKLTLQTRATGDFGGKGKKIEVFCRCTSPILDWVKLGTFYVSESVTKNGVTAVTAYDMMSRLDKTVKWKDTGTATAPTFPCSMQKMLNYICARFDISTDFTCQDITIQKAPDGYTGRELISYIAACHGANARFSPGGKLIIRPYTQTAVVVQYGRCYAMECSDDTFTVNGILFDTGGGTKIYIDGTAAEYNENADGIVEVYDPFATVGISEFAWNQLGNLSYSAVSLEMPAENILEPGDVFTIKDADGAEHTAIVMEQILSVSCTGGFMEKISCEAESKKSSRNAENRAEATEKAAQNSVLNSYEYLADNSVKFNGVTYTVEKDSATGLISKISDSDGNAFEPTINSGITDATLHNAVFWAVAMCRGLPNPLNIVELYNAGNEHAGITGGWFKSAEIMRDGYSTVSMTKQASYIELTSEMYYTTNAHNHNAFIAAGTVNKVDVTDYSKIVAEFDCEGTNKKGRAEFVIYVTGSYDVNQWLYTDIVMKYVYSPPANSDYSEIGLVLSTDKIASLTGAYYISFGFGGTNAERKGSCKLKRVYLER